MSSKSKSLPAPILLFLLFQIVSSSAQDSLLQNINQQKFALVPESNLPVNNFSVSLNGDRALLGISHSGYPHDRVGNSFIFDYDGKQWIQTAELGADESKLGNHFGYSVSLSNNRVLISDLFDNNGLYGASYIFDYDGESWVKTIKFQGDKINPSYDRYGRAVSLDGDRALVSAITDSRVSGVSLGAVYVYDFNDDQWINTGKIVPDEPGGEFGISVSLDGNRAAIGSRNYAYDGKVKSGGVFVYDYNGLNWELTQKIFTEELKPGDGFGHSVSLDKNRLLIGTFKGSHFDGIAYIYEFDGVNWNQTTSLEPANNETASNFGFSVSLEGDKALVSATNLYYAGVAQGAGYLYEYNGIEWKQTTKLEVNREYSDNVSVRQVSLSEGRSLLGAVYGGGRDYGYIYLEDKIFYNGLQPPPVL